MIKTQKYVSFKCIKSCIAHTIQIFLKFDIFRTISGNLSPFLMLIFVCMYNSSNNHSKNRLIKIKLYRHCNGKKNIFFWLLENFVREKEGAYKHNVVSSNFLLLISPRKVLFCTTSTPSQFVLVEKEMNHSYNDQIWWIVVELWYILICLMIQYCSFCAWLIRKYFGKHGIGWYSVTIISISLDPYH